MVWVDGKSLRRFVACDVRFPHTGVGGASSFLCRHGSGLHPRVAQRGKVISEDTFNALRFLEAYETNGEIQDTPPAGTHGIPVEQLYCHACQLSYIDEMKQKVNTIRNLMSLSSGLNETTSTSGDAGRNMLISRRFVTQFRDAFTKLCKEALSTAVGLDGFDVSKLHPTKATDNSIDPLVNTSILCKCSEAQRKLSFFFMK